MKYTARAALAKILLQGTVLNIKSGFEILGITNLPREVSRSIEKPFGVEVSRTRRDGQNRFGQPVYWFEYRLNQTEYNKEGIEKMKQYVRDHFPEPRTTNEKKQYQQAKLL